MHSPFHCITHICRYAAHFRCSLCCATLISSLRSPSHASLLLLPQTCLLPLHPLVTSYKNMHAPIAMSSLSTLPASCPHTLSHDESTTTTLTIVLTTSILPTTHLRRHLCSPSLLPHVFYFISTHV